LRTALEHRPGHAAALNNLGFTLRALGRLAEAVACYAEAAARDPGLDGLQGNYGSALLALGRAEEALPRLRAAVRQAPENAMACNNMGGVLLALDAAPEAARWFRHAVRLDPGLCQARFGLALALLAQGDFRRGWQEYEARWSDPAFIADEATYAAPVWRGEPPAGRTILLHAEQGLGDTLQFARYAPLVRARGARVVLEVQPPLVPVLERLADMVVARGAALPAYDLHCPLLSLPFACGTELATIPADIPYLAVPPGRVAAWTARLGERRRPRIGIAFSGDPAHPEDAQRSIPLARFRAAFAGVEAELHLLQTAIRPADLGAAEGLVVHGAALADFADTAALVLLMDRVVTVDTALAHVAGALGRPAAVLVQFGADFRWLRGRADSPWYPSLRLYRQPRYGEWEGALAAVNAALRSDLG
jgi:tetratricopeptide (TPR) repeat protein